MTKTTDIVTRAVAGLIFAGVTQILGWTVSYGARDNIADATYNAPAGAMLIGWPLYFGLLPYARKPFLYAILGINAASGLGTLIRNAGLYDLFHSGHPMINVASASYLIAWPLVLAYSCFLVWNRR
ncbi:MAG TPA: hypothetical protein VMF06_01405 [Candidatus Limnocylindria bacterium]|jgi:hypothetical protein|nr:hypothetical protein [Candidatus Limnocylindria bacterium]